MSHNFKFTSVSVETSIADLADSFLPAENRYGMEQKDCLAIARLAVNKFLADSPEYTDERKSEYKFKRNAGKKDDKRDEYRRIEKNAGGISRKDNDEQLGVDLGWFDEKIRIIEKDLGSFVVSLPASIEKGLIDRWTNALKQREANAKNATNAPAPQQ